MFFGIKESICLFWVNQRVQFHLGTLKNILNFSWKMQIFLASTIFCSVKAFIGSAIGHRSALKLRIAQARTFRAHASSHQNTVLLKKFFARYPKKFTFRKKGTKIQNAKNARLSRFRNFHMKKFL